MPGYRKKLIEVALPLEAINKESAREKSIRHGHPSTLHLWWARRPLAACRAVLFAQMVDDPSSLLEEFPTEEMQEVERQRLFRIIEELVKWENTTNEAVLHTARIEIARSAARNHGISLPRNMTPAEVAITLKQYAPPVLDPFAGGGSIPLEAQRLGLEAHASDLNPVAVLINKALIEIPPRFVGRVPVNRESREKYLHKEWEGCEGLAEDIRYYGEWIRTEAWNRIGHLYPKVQLSKEFSRGEVPIIAWIWARTVRCPNPACGAQMPLVRSFVLAMKKGKEAWIEPVVDRVAKTVRFEVRYGVGAPESTVNRLGAKCIVCGNSVSFDHVRAEGRAGRMHAQMMAIVAEGKGSRIYVSPNDEQCAIANDARPTGVPETDLPEQALGFRVQLYGMTKHRALFSPRQLVALTTFTDLVVEVRGRVLQDTGGDVEYADAVTIYLALAASKAADNNCTLCSWMPGIKYEVVRNAFSRQALSMNWDYAESNPFAHSSGDYFEQVSRTVKVLEMAIQVNNLPIGFASQCDSRFLTVNARAVVSTDPPYYDNIGYADLSDFFYVWLRRSLGSIYPSLFSTLLTPKVGELVATPYRFDGRADLAKRSFEEGLSVAFTRMRNVEDMDYPLTVYYAFKQVDSEGEDSQGDISLEIASTGWETMLEALLLTGFSITGTWPIRTERNARTRGLGSNALASSIVLVCRPRLANAPLTTRREFLNALKRELPEALKDLQRGNIAPVDLAQAAIGPGMSVFSRYSKVLESDGTPMRVRTALQLINQTLDEVLAEQEGEYDTDTRWALAWFEQFGMEEGPYGMAETLSKAKNTSVGTLAEAGILEARGGKVRLLRRNELSSDWKSAAVKRLTVWEVTQRLIRALQEQGDQGAAAILDHVGAYRETARDLAYRLYTTCERKKWAEEAMAYNSLVVEWPDISSELELLEKTTTEQAPLF